MLKWNLEVPAKALYFPVIILAYVTEIYDCQWRVIAASRTIEMNVLSESTAGVLLASNVQAEAFLRASGSLCGNMTPRSAFSSDWIPVSPHYGFGGNCDKDDVTGQAVVTRKRLRSRALVLSTGAHI
ncbi:UNVERIFIED_CONTAM: hypothetical protein FKN15_070676 [Acipenser sinensis]